MPQREQEPLSKLRFTCSADLSPAPTAPPGTPVLTVAGTKRMEYYGSHLWGAAIEIPPTPDLSISLLCSVFLDWSNWCTTLGVWAYTYPTDVYPGGGKNWNIGTCDATSPWHTGPQAWASPDGYAAGTCDAARDMSTLLPLVAMMSSSPTVRGPIDGNVVYFGPRYPAGAIYGETPPTTYAVGLRRKAENVQYSDPGQLARRVNFATAAEQWSALDLQQRQAWDEAAQTTTPKTTGYALWTKLATTHRADRVATLARRIGKTLTPPDI